MRTDNAFERVAPSRVPAKRFAPSWIEPDRGEALLYNCATCAITAQPARRDPYPGVAMIPDDPIGAKAAFEREVSCRFGVMPNFFCSASAAPGLIEELWAFAKSAFLDNPLPSLFKERLFVHLSRFCEVRYCIIRHVGFLIGEGWPAGDPKAGPQTIQQVITLLQRPLPDAKALAGVFDRLESNEQPMDIPVEGTQAEHDLFDALTVMFLEPVRWERAREAVRRAVATAGSSSLQLFSPSCAPHTSGPKRILS